MVNSREKGKRGEREWAAWLKEHGLEARRGQQFAGGTDSPDVICEQLKDYHFEVKRTERLNLEQAMAQAKRDAGAKAPVVAYKRNRGEWLVTMPAEAWLAWAKSSTEC